MNATGEFSNGCDSHFAPAGRDATDELLRKHAAVEGDAALRALLNSMPSWTLVLNERRQVVSANSALLNLVGSTQQEVIGKRPGEIIGCVRADGGPDGCGTSPDCAGCGAVLALLESQLTGKTATGECTLRTKNGSWGRALELRATASRLKIGNETLTVVTLEDISDRNRLSVLTRVFFHDAMNTIVGLKTHLKVLEKKAARGPVGPQEIARLVGFLDDLSDEIRSQREVMLAEAGDLQVEPEAVFTTELIERLQEQHSAEGGSDGRIFLGEIWDGELTTDAHLLGRVLRNMIRNALEATAPGRPVTLGCLDQGEWVRFFVHNQEVMTEEVQRQVFHRSFSTKPGTGRGIGTHCMKLIGERYLCGSVDFTSKEQAGTTFWIDLPKRPPAS